MASDYKKTSAGEEFEIPLDFVWTQACCDCGLVHEFRFKIRDGKLFARAERNNRATGQLRRYRDHTCKKP